MMSLMKKALLLMTDVEPYLDRYHLSSRRVCFGLNRGGLWYIFHISDFR